MPIIISGPLPVTQTLTLDALAEDAANTPLELNGGDGIGVLEMSFPAPPAKLQYASSVDTEGSLLASAGYENRSISLKVDCEDYNALVALQAKVAKIAREQGTLTWVTPTGETITFDLLAAPNYEATFDHAFLAGVTSVSFAFDAAPFGRGPEITLADHVETTAPALIFTETGIKGDVPGGVEITVDNDAATDQIGLVWGVRSRYYSSASTAALYKEAETLTGLGGAAAAVGSAGASGAGSNVMKQTTLGTGLARMFGTGDFTHIGAYRVFARVFAPVTNAGTVSVRFGWTGLGVAEIQNDSVTLDSALEGSWQLVDLGQINIPVAPVGTQVWTGFFYAMSTTGTDDLEVDFLLFVPIDEGDGQITGTGPGSGYSAIAASSSSLLSSDGVFVLETGRWQRPYLYEGDYPRIPPAGLGGRTVEWVFKASRAPIVSPPTAADGAIDAISARITYTPRYLVVPGV